MDAAHQSTAITPSVSARQLFGRMVARAEHMTLGLDQTIALSVHRKREGQDPHAIEEVSELVNAGWIRPSSDTDGWEFTDGD